VMGSVGNYLAMHGWQRGAPIAARATLTDGVPTGIPVAGKRPALPQESLAQLGAAGVVPAAGALADSPPADARVALLELDGDGPEYWLGFENFYAITRYNQSNLYAMAVFQLSREIAAGSVPGPVQGPVQDSVQGPAQSSAQGPALSPAQGSGQDSARQVADDAAG